MNKKQIATYPLILMENLRKHKVLFFVCLFFFMLVILSLLDYYTSESFKQSFWGGVLVEAHGMFLDIILFGILLTIYERFTERKNEIDRLTEEIDDYRGWDEPEAMYRIVGCIKRLNKKGVTKINLESTFLKNANLSNLNLTGSTFWLANLENVIADSTIFDRCKFDYSIIRNSTFIDSSFKQSSFDTTYILNSKFYGCDFKNTYFEFTNLIDLYFNRTSLEAHSLSNSYISNIKFNIDGTQTFINQINNYFENLDSHLIEEIEYTDEDTGEVVDYIKIDSKIKNFLSGIESLDYQSMQLVYKNRISFY